MLELLHNTTVACTCKSCGKQFSRWACKLPVSVTEQEQYEAACSICDDCIQARLEKAIKDDRAAKYRAERQAAKAARHARRRTAADIIQEYNLKHMCDKKGSVK